MECGGTCLSEDVKVAVRELVLRYVETWKSLPEDDLRVVSQRIGPGRYSRNVQPRRGLTALVQLHSLIDNDATVRALENLCREKQPELGNAVGTELSCVQARINQVVINLVQQVGASTDPVRDIDYLLEELDELLRTRSVDFTLVAPFNSMVPLPPDLRIDLGIGALVRSLNENDFEYFTNHSVLEDGNDNSFGPPVGAIEVPFVSRLFLSFDESHHSKKDQASEALRTLDRARYTLHVFRETSLYLPRAWICCKRRSLPFLDGSRLTIGAPGHSRLTLSQADAPALVALAQRLMSSNRKELHLASRRLRDAESRLDAVDSLVDALVGLESLLNPEKGSEVSLRMAMNLASLVPTEERRSKFSLFRDLYNVRSQVVHGGDAQSQYRVSGKAVTVAAVADQARQLLRQVIGYFLADDMLRSEQRLDSKAWEARYFR